ncbi:hypothetical protein AB3S75_009795 [Citrus x aurantiifolia]
MLPRRNLRYCTGILRRQLVE